MRSQVTVKLHGELYENAKRWATITRRDLPDTLADVIALVLSPIDLAPGSAKPIAQLSNREVLALSHARLKPVQGRRLSDLLQKQREGVLTGRERRDLAALIQVYNQIWLRQSEALAEAVRRGLREPLKP